ncbi:MAG: hypothetical protein A2Y22_04365 [Clostridiales bacterium GWD2_32_59]|nr:MAG: hypothetical protein A2Y22_04365 [Clostridiales bacterium GWD2_32_59]
MNGELKIRKNVRLPNYDYSTEGIYFITICLNNKKNLFGEIKDGKLVKNDKGFMIERFWNEMNNKYQNINLEEYIIMPNHIHGLIQIKKYEEPLQNIIGWFKTMTTNQYIKNVKENDWERFDGKLWQRNYYEHVIRHEKELYEIRKYIQENPIVWEKDKFYYSDNYI